jgi:predicted phosphoribosyltransferase
VVLGIPRGGVPVAAEIARQLGAKLDVIVARKIPAPMSPEFAIGAVTADGARYLSSEALWSLGVAQAYLDAATEREVKEALERHRRYHQHLPAEPLQGKVAIVVDDGLATGATVCAAVRAVRRQRPAKLVVAVPVGSAEACQLLESEADDVVCIHQPEPFHAVGLHYRDFEPTRDAEVLELLHEARDRAAGSPPA